MSDNNLSSVVINENIQDYNLTDISNPKVSVIIPVYNVEKYVAQCLDSIINQTLKDIEIICINDGSTDNSLEVLEEYAQKDSRIRVFTQSNKGLGATRNVGIERASGKYIYFIDSDDFINLDTLEIAYTNCEEKSLDFTMFQLINYDDETKEFYSDDLYNMTNLVERFGDNVFNYKDCDGLFFSLAVSACNKFFNREFLLKNNIRFPVGLSFEDNVVHYKSFLLAERVAFIEKHLYNRRRRKGSITSSNNKNYFDTIEITDLVFDVFNDLNQFDNFEQRLFNYKVSNIFVWYNKINKIYKEEFYFKIKDNFRVLEESPELYDKYISNLFHNNKVLLRDFMESTNPTEFDKLIEIENLRLSNSANKPSKQISNPKINAIFRRLVNYIKKLKSN